MRAYQTLAARPRQSLRRAIPESGRFSGAARPGSDWDRGGAWLGKAGPSGGAGPPASLRAAAGNGKLIGRIACYRAAGVAPGRAHNAKIEGNQVDLALDSNYVRGFRLFSIRRSGGGRPDQGK